MGLPVELMFKTKIKQDKSENHVKVNKILNCTLILHNRWAEDRTKTQNYHNIVIINVGKKITIL
jgi:hypothetical protein